ncbi:hypothetical protein BH18GEM1_BH18GEM1_09940 [soil metagenome]
MSQRGIVAAGMALAFAAAVEPPAPLCAQRPVGAGAIEIVLDASGSMRELIGQKERMVVARTFLSALRRDLARGGPPPRMSLRVYGERGPSLGQDCGETSLVLRASEPAAAWDEKVAALNPLGGSPLALALDHAASDSATAYVLITDRAGSCGRNACDVWREVVARAGGNRRARLHVVALAPARAELERLRCLSRAGSGSLTVLSDKLEVSAAADRLALILRNRGLLDVRLHVGEGDPFVAPVRVLTPLTGEVVTSFAARWPHAVPAGMYTVVAETAPAATFERVMVLPGETVVLEASEFGRLQVDVRGLAGEGVRAPVSVQRSTRGPELRYAATGERMILGAGRYDVTVDLGDSVAIRDDVRVRQGETTRIVLGGAGTLRIEVPEFAEPPPTTAVAYRDGRADTLALGETTVLPAGRYRLVVHTLPIYVTEEVVIEPGRTTTIVLPETGVLGADLYGLDGLEIGQRIKVREAQTGEIYDTVASGERRLAMPGTYRLDLNTVPPRTIEGVVVTAGESHVIVRRGLSRITLAAPVTRERGAVRLEVLGADGRPLAEATGLQPTITVWPGTYRARVTRDGVNLWQGRVSVAPDKWARIDFPVP